MGKTSTAAKNKWNANNYDRVAFNVKKGDRERYKQIAEQNGQSLNAFILQAIEEYINNHGL